MRQRERDRERERYIYIYTHTSIYIYTYIKGPAKNYILRGTPQTYAIKTRPVTDNETIKKGPPRKWNRGPVRGTDGPISGTEGPVTGTGPLLTAQIPF